MKKFSKLLALLLAACMALALAACGEAPAAESEEPAAVSEEPAAESGAPAEDAEVAPLTVGLLGTAVKPVGVLVGDALGYFDEEGVEIDFEKVSSMNDAYMAVSTGDLDVYLFSSTAAATFIAQGTTTLRVFGGTVGEGSEIMAAAGTPEITGLEDLLGKTIACQMPETGQMVLKNYIMEQGYTFGAPGEGADITFVYVNDAIPAIEGCVKGEYDYCITNSCLGYYADQYGAALVGTVKQFVDPYPCCRQTCNEATYEENFEALVRFEIANLRGYEYYLNNMEETLDILEDCSGEDRDFLQAQLYGTEGYTPVMRVSLDPDKDACVEFYQAMVNIGEVEDTGVDWDQYVVTDVYSTALERLMEREPDNALWQDLSEYFAGHNS